MKFTVSMKDPDTLGDAIQEAIEEELNDKYPDLDKDEREVLAEKRREKIGELCGKWFEWGEYLRVEIDTDAITCTVLPAE